MMQLESFSAHHIFWTLSLDWEKKDESEWETRSLESASQLF